jgi:hypothetical protein
VVFFFILFRYKISQNVMHMVFFLLLPTCDDVYIHYNYVEIHERPYNKCSVPSVLRLKTYGGCMSDTRP